MGTCYQPVEASKEKSLLNRKLSPRERRFWLNNCSETESIQLPFIPALLRKILMWCMGPPSWKIWEVFGRLFKGKYNICRWVYKLYSLMNVYEGSAPVPARQGPGYGTFPAPRSLPGSPPSHYNPHLLTTFWFLWWSVCFARFLFFLFFF